MNSLFKLFLQILIGGVGTTALCLVLYLLFTAVFAPFGWAIAFVAPFVFIGLAITVLPAVITIIAGLFSPEKIGYAAGAFFAVLLQMAIPMVKASLEASSYEERATQRAILPLTATPRGIVLECGNCYGLDDVILATTDVPLVMIRGRNSDRKYQLSKLPAQECKPGKQVE
ncbi:MAG: hypothetical protein H7X89_05430 [Rhizobiales bacterium]|nr:hypothetical protein [Hyphomicrobiales bacterium]